MIIIIITITVIIVTAINNNPNNKLSYPSDPLQAPGTEWASCKQNKRILQCSIAQHNITCYNIMVCYVIVFYSIS